MDLTIIIIIAIILAVLIVSFIWKLLKTVLKVAIVAVIAFAIFMLITSVIKPDVTTNPANDTEINVTNVTNEITAQVTGFVSTTFEKAKAQTKKAIAENMLEEAESDLKALE